MSLCPRLHRRRELPAELLGGDRQGHLADDAARGRASPPRPTAQAVEPGARHARPPTPPTPRTRSPRSSSSSTARRSARTTSAPYTRRLDRRPTEDSTSSTRWRRTTTGLTHDSRKVPLHGRRVRRPAAVDHVQQRLNGGDVRPARDGRSASPPRAPTSGRAPTSTAPSTCRAARREHFDAVVKVASFDGTHAASKAGHHGPQRHLRSAATRPATSSSPRRATARPSSCTTRDGNGQLNATGGRWRPVRHRRPAEVAEAAPRRARCSRSYCSSNGTTGRRSARRRRSRPRPTCRTSACSSCRTSPARSRRPSSRCSLPTSTRARSRGSRRPAAAACAGGAVATSSTGDALDAGAGRTVRGAPVVGGGSATLPVTNGDIDGANTGAISFLGQPAPAGDWPATTKLTLEQDNDWQYAGLLLHVDDDNYRRWRSRSTRTARASWSSGPRPTATRTTHGNNVAVPADSGTTVQVRLTQRRATADRVLLARRLGVDADRQRAAQGRAPSIGLVAAGDLGRSRTRRPRSTGSA